MGSCSSSFRCPHRAVSSSSEAPRSGAELRGVPIDIDINMDIDIGIGIDMDNGIDTNVKIDIGTGLGIDTDHINS